MTINMEKGQKTDLTKTNPGLNMIKVGLGWDVNKQGGGQFDLDASVFLLKADGKCAGPDDMIYFHHLKHASGSVIHSGDNLTGAGEGDDEVVTVELNKVPPAVEKLAFVINIYQADTRKQNFGMVKNAFARVINASDNKELVKFDLSEDQSVNTGVLIAEIYRHSGEWKFAAVGTGSKAGLTEFAKQYGLS